MCVGVMISTEGASSNAVRAFLAFYRQHYQLILMLVTVFRIAKMWWTDWVVLNEKTLPKPHLRGCTNMYLSLI